MKNSLLANTVDALSLVTNLEILGGLIWIKRPAGEDNALMVERLELVIENTTFEKHYHARKLLNPYQRYATYVLNHKTGTGLVAIKQLIERPVHHVGTTIK